MNEILYRPELIDIIHRSVIVDEYFVKVDLSNRSVNPIIVHIAGSDTRYHVFIIRDVRNLKRIKEVIMRLN